MGGKPLAYINHPLVEIFLRRTNGAVPINIPGYFLAYIGVSRGFCALSQNTRLIKRFDPHLPVFTAHDGNRVINFILIGRF